MHPPYCTHHTVCNNDSPAPIIGPAPTIRPAPIIQPVLVLRPALVIRPASRPCQQPPCRQKAVAPCGAPVLAQGVAWCRPDCTRIGNLSASRRPVEDGGTTQAAAPAPICNMLEARQQRRSPQQRFSPWRGLHQALCAAQRAGGARAHLI